MQDRYVGDVGDFGKFGLLRILSGLENDRQLKLGVVWYLYPDESHNADGKHISYLQRDGGFRCCDEELYDKLRVLLFDDLGLIAANRKISSVEEAHLLPEGTSYYSVPLAYDVGMSHTAKISKRAEWFAGALAETHSSDLVFLDPDNGIECSTVTKTKPKGPKYVFWDDLDAWVGRDQSIVVYHHLNRNGSHLQQVEDMRNKMRMRFAKGFDVFAVTYRRGTSRAYFVIAAPLHRELLSQRLEEMCSSPWGQHFSFA